MDNLFSVPTTEHDQQTTDEKTRMFKWNAALMYHKVSPSLSRMMMWQFMRTEHTSTMLKTRVQRSICSFCGSVFQPGNHYMRISPKSKISKRIKKLSRMQTAAPWKLKGMRKKQLYSANIRKGKMIYKCLECNKCTKHSWIDDSRLSQKINESSIQKTKNTTRHADLKATPHFKTMPNSTQSSITLLKKSTKLSASKKKNKGCKLKAMLEKHAQSSTTSRLKSFLSSL